LALGYLNAFMASGRTEWLGSGVFDEQGRMDIEEKLAY
jgi:hypothetical protein